MVTCKCCGARNKDDSLFCDYCGTSLKELKHVCGTTELAQFQAWTAQMQKADKSDVAQKLDTAQGRWDRHKSVIEKIADSLVEASIYSILVDLQYDSQCVVEIGFNTDSVDVLVRARHSSELKSVRFFSLGMGNMPVSNIPSFAQFFSPIYLDSLQKNITQKRNGHYTQSSYSYIKQLAYRWGTLTTRNNQRWEHHLHINNIVNSW